MAPRPTTPILQIGDRVRERKFHADHVVTPSSPNYKLVRDIIRDHRYGNIVGIETKQGSSGSRTTYINVLWDGRHSPSTHAQARLEHVTASA